MLFSLSHESIHLSIIISEKMASVAYMYHLTLERALPTMHNLNICIYAHVKHTIYMSEQMENYHFNKTNPSLCSTSIHIKSIAFRPNIFCDSISIRLERFHSEFGFIHNQKAIKNGMSLQEK